MLQNKLFDDELTYSWALRLISQAQQEMIDKAQDNPIIDEKQNQIAMIEASMGNHLSKAQIEQKQQNIKTLDDEICALMDKIYSQLDTLDKNLNETAQNVTSAKTLNKLIAQYRKEALQAIQAVK